MPLFDLYPIESSSSIIEKKRYEYVITTQTTSVEKPNPYHFFNYKQQHQFRPSFTKVTMSNQTFKRFLEEYKETPDDYDVFVSLPIKKSFRVKIKIKSVSKLRNTPFID